MNKENLKRLALYLLRDDRKLIFHMGCFINSCGSVGCAVGNGPDAGMPKNSNESWEQYCERVFGVKTTSDEWKWLFDGDWESMDNTPTGAAKRILYLLDGNSTPQQTSYYLDPYAFDEEVMAAYQAIDVSKYQYPLTPDLSFPPPGE